MRISLKLFSSRNAVAPPTESIQKSMTANIVSSLFTDKAMNDVVDIVVLQDIYSSLANNIDEYSKCQGNMKV